MNVPKDITFTLYINTLNVHCDFPLLPSQEIFARVQKSTFKIQLLWCVCDITLISTFYESKIHQPSEAKAALQCSLVVKLGGWSCSLESLAGSCETTKCVQKKCDVTIYIYPGTLTGTNISVRLMLNFNGPSGKVFCFGMTHFLLFCR